MQKTLLTISSIVLLSSILCANTNTFELFSPNGEIKLFLNITDKLYYHIYYNDDILLENCYMQLVLFNEVLGENPKLSNSKQEKVSETIKPYVPLKYAAVKNEYNKLLLNFKGGYSIEFRAFDEGIAYRFISNLKRDIEVIDEIFAISFPDNYLLHMQQPRSFKTAYEEPYTHINTEDFVNKERDMCVLPVLIDTKKVYKILISESDLSDYPCMFLRGTENNGIEAVFPKVPLNWVDNGDRGINITEEAEYIAKTSGKRTYPWRYFVLTKNDGQLIENTMTLKLSSPCEIKDPTWIIPGQASWEWWNAAAPYGPDVNFVSGCNLDTYKYYIDFASRFGIEYIIMDEGWTKSTRDPYTPNPDVNVYEIIRYGKEKT